MEPTGPETPAPPPPPPTPPTDARETAARLVNPPAIALLVTAGLAALFSVIGLLGNLFGFGFAGMPDLGQDDRFAMLAGGAIGTALNLLGLIAVVLVFFGALRMRQLRSWGLALTASIVAMTPCIGLCCVAGLPIGIWALVILLKPEVKSAFAA